MLLSIIGNLFGHGDDDQTDSENTADDQFSGSMGGDSLLPGDGGGGGMESDDDLFGGGDPFAAEESDLGGGGMEFDDEAGAVSSEFESRVDEMETEIGSLASTVNTVQSENENISESLEDIEENIRKLLEVYEMVTQGVNPFIEGDSLSESFGAAEGSGDFGGQSLFDSAEGEQGDDTVESDIADAEAEDFLDEEMLDDDFADDGFGDDELGDNELGGDGGDEALSFEELKSEYDSGDADWAGGDELTGDGEDELGIDSEPASTTDPFADDPEPAEQPPLGGGLDDSEAAHATPGDDARSKTLWPDDDRPYLASVPSGYEAELVAMDWVEYLIEEAGLNGAARTVRFYHSVDWIGESVEEYLRTLLNGFDGGPDIEDPTPASSLGVDHKRSLWWISQVATPEKKPVSFEEWLREESIAPEGADAEDAVESERERPTDSGGIDRDAAVTDAPSGSAVDSREGRWGESTETGEGELDERNAQRILIDESGESATTERDRRERAPVTEQNIETEGGRMIWVDSDVVLPESSIELRFTQEEYDRPESVEYVHSVFDTRDADGVGGFDDRQGPVIDSRRDEDVKPLVVPDEESGLEGWQLELLESLFAADERGQ